MDLEAQMEAQIHFLEAQLVFWRPMGLCTLQGPNPLSPSVIFGDRTLASLPSADHLKELEELLRCAACPDRRPFRPAVTGQVPRRWLR